MSTSRSQPLVRTKSWGWVARRPHRFHEPAVFGDVVADGGKTGLLGGLSSTTALPLALSLRIVEQFCCRTQRFTLRDCRLACWSGRPGCATRNGTAGYLEAIEIGTYGLK